MSAITIQLPDSLFSALMALSKRDGVPAENILAAAAAEKVSAIYGVDFLSQRAANAPSQEDYLRILSKTPNNPTDPGDEW